MNSYPPHFGTQVGIGTEMWAKPEKCPNIWGHYVETLYRDKYLTSGDILSTIAYWITETSLQKSHIA